MRYLAPLGAVAGLALLTGLTAYYGFDAVLQAVVRSEWATIWVVLARALALVLAGIGWWLLVSPLSRQGYGFVVLRFVREAINALLPFAVVGGDIVGARLLAQFGVATTVAIASVMIDIFIQVLCLLVFVAIGVGIVIDLAGSHRLNTLTFVVLAVALPAVGGFFLALNFGGFEPVMRFLVIFGEKRRWPAFRHVVHLGGRLQDIWRNHLGLSASFFVHLAGMFFGAAEVWLALHFMGHSVSLAQAIAIESLGQGSRAVVFLLPAGIGVQDGALVAAAAIFGIPADVALAMALIKRVPDLVLGVPALFGWQGLEGRRILAAGRTRPNRG